MTRTQWITPASPPKDVHPIWCAAWWPVARAVAATGTDCTVLDPDARRTIRFYEGEGHGVITVHPHTALGWTVTVSEAETDQADDE